MNKIAAIIMLCLCCLSFALAANTAPTSQTEQQLDDYLTLLIDNAPEALPRLEQILAQLSPDTPINSQVRALSYHIRNHLMYTKTDLALQRAEHLLQQAHAGGQQNAITEALLTQFNVLVFMLEQQQPLSLALQQYLPKLIAELKQNLAETTDLRIQYVGHILLAGMHMNQQSDYESALAHYMSAYDVVQQTDDNHTARRLIYLLEHFSRIHLIMENPATAYPYITRAIDIAIEHNIKFNLSLLYLLKAYTEEKLQQPDLKLSSLETGLYWAEQMEEQNTAVSILHNIAVHYQKKKRHDKAKTLLNDALQKAVALSDAYNINNIMMSLGTIYVESGNQQQGLALIEQSLPYFRQTSDIATWQSVLGEVAEAYQQAGQYQQQAAALLEQRSLREEVFQAERDQRITELRQRFEATEQAQKARLLEQENINQARLLENKRLQHNLTLLQLRRYWLFTVLFGSLVMLAVTLLFLLRLKRANTRLRGLAARLENIREEERKRIARDMHDEMGQYLTTLRLEVSGLAMLNADKDPRVTERTQALKTLVDQTIQVMRSIAASLRPAPMDMGGVLALEWLANEFSQRTGIACQVSINDVNLVLSDSYLTALFRIVQESLTNIARHANASEVRITLTVTQHDLHLQIVDNGQGFNPADIKAQSYGLTGMRERALMLGGELLINSAFHKGTTISFRVQLPKEHQQQPEQGLSSYP